MVLPVVTAERVSVTAGDGVTLGLRRIVGPGAPARRTPLLLMHGTFSTWHFFGAPHGLGAFLAGQGHDVWVGELRGHGRSDLGGHAGDFDDWILRDVPALLAAVRAATGALR